ncbi:MAG: amidase family protein, partial [Kiloniellaceae bacterium]
MSLDALLDDHDGLALADLIRRGEVSPLEVLDAVAARIDARNPAVNVVVHTNYEEARAELAAGPVEGPFAGLPFLVKDLYSFRKGWPCGNGSDWLADYRAPFADPMVAGRRAAPEAGKGKPPPTHKSHNQTPPPPPPRPA